VLWERIDLLERGTMEKNFQILFYTPSSDW
jgi:hypothetical protein